MGLLPVPKRTWQSLPFAFLSLTVKGREKGKEGGREGGQKKNSWLLKKTGLYNDFIVNY